MSFGLSQFCQQMTTHSAPLKLAADAPVTGRFFPEHCTQQTLDNGDLLVQFDGMGYAFTPLSRKVSFTSGATIQYDEDFKCAPTTTRSTRTSPRARLCRPLPLLQIEIPGASLVAGWITPYANNFGTQMVSSQLAAGFTVIQGDDGSTDFSVGRLALGQRPPHPFDVHGQNRLMVESLKTQVYAQRARLHRPHRGQGLGSRPLPDDAARRSRRRSTSCSCPRRSATRRLMAYINNGPVGPLPGPPQWSDVLQYGAQYQRAVPVAPGMYYVVIDNTPSAGQVAPPASLPLVGAGQPAVVNYEIQIGDAP